MHRAAENHGNATSTTEDQGQTLTKAATEENTMGAPAKEVKKESKEASAAGDTPRKRLPLGLPRYQGN